MVATDRGSSQERDLFGAPAYASPRSAQQRVPHRQAKSIRGENGGDHGDGLDALDAFMRPIHVGEPEPERELVERQAERHPKDHGNPQMPAFAATRQRTEARDHQQQDAPEEMMDM